MTLKRCVPVGIGVLLVCVALSAVAQSGEKYKLRLSPAPALRSTGAKISVAAASVAGSGNGSATLTGMKLSVSGTFEMLASAATEAHLFLGPAMGARDYGSKPLFDLMVMKTGDGKGGTFSGSFDLTTEQIDALKKGRIYMQLHSEGAPTGHLLGWLVK